MIINKTTNIVEEERLLRAIGGNISNKYQVNLSADNLAKLMRYAVEEIGIEAIQGGLGSATIGANTSGLSYTPEDAERVCQVVKMLPCEVFFDIISV